MQGRQVSTRDEKAEIKSSFKAPVTPCRVTSTAVPVRESNLKNGQCKIGQSKATSNTGIMHVPSQLQQQQLKPLIPYAAHVRMSQEELVDQMEKEQDAIVMLLLREIDTLREENSRLRRNMGQIVNGEPLSCTPPQSRRSSIASLRQLQLFGTCGSMASTPSTSRRSSFSQIDNLKSDLQKKRNSGCNYPITLNNCTLPPLLSATSPHFDAMMWPQMSQEKVSGGMAMLGGHKSRCRRQSTEPSAGSRGCSRMSKIQNKV